MSDLKTDCKMSDGQTSNKKIAIYESALLLRCKIYENLSKLA